jgi:hypothetical protein
MKFKPDCFIHPNRHCTHKRQSECPSKPLLRDLLPIEHTTQLSTNARVTRKLQVTSQLLRTGSLSEWTKLASWPQMMVLAVPSDGVAPWAPFRDLVSLLENVLSTRLDKLRFRAKDSSA